MTLEDLITGIAEVVGVDAKNVEVEFKDGTMHVEISGVEEDDFDDADEDFGDDGE